MTNQEALEIITNAIQKSGMTVEQDRALALAQKALKQCTPFYPKVRHSTRYGDRYNDGECPTCGATYSDALSDTPLFCSQCGQAFDWGDCND